MAPQAHALLDRMASAVRSKGLKLTLADARRYDEVLAFCWKIHHKLVDTHGTRHHEVVSLRQKLQVVQDLPVVYLHSSRPGRPRRMA